MRTASILVLLSLLCACGGTPATCTLGSAEGCTDGLVCEAFPGGEARCTQPVYLEGLVFDALDTSAIEGARIVARDANGGARSPVAFSDAAGLYSLRVAIARDAEGRPEAEAVTLRADAADYASFPQPPREALPIDLGAATLDEARGRWVIDNAATDVALLPLEGPSGSTIEGVVMHADAGGVLVVAEQGGVAVSTSITDTDGTFVLYNVPAGSTLVAGYRAGLAVTPQTVDAVPAGVQGVALSATDSGLATVTGRVTIVNAPGGLTTSVILVVASTFDDAVARGEAPAGLRVAGVTGDFSIANVPPGRYAVLAAFENDQLVRDPDLNIAGTQIVFVDVAGADVPIATDFKITEALAVIGPGANGLEVVTSAPTLRWAQDSSEEGYELRVYDAFGTVVHENTNIPEPGGSAPVEYSLSAVSLQPGMIYQFRAWSFARGSRLSATEDLRGVFQYQP
ncbi:MAG: hypothetical protein IT378_07570 [Sandaracinaceae bacterium]|nr:hypothetical protein [Sandaracinaceae bacterium]